MQDKITVLIDYLNGVKTRCTYNAAAEALGITPQAVKKLLGERRPEISWLVNSGTGEPAGYTDSEKHPELYRTKRVIKSAEVLTRNLHWEKVNLARKTTL
jgi:hypothetical protein